MQANVRREPRDDKFSEEEEITRPLPPSGQWIAAVDRAASRLEEAMRELDDGCDPSSVADLVREAHSLVTRGTP